MRRLVTLVLLALLAACASPRSPVSCATAKATPAELGDKTVALVQAEAEDDQISVRAYCTGVWVGPKTIVTAAHCVVGESSVLFATRSDLLEGSAKREYPTVREAVVLKVDETHDLAVLESTGRAIEPVMQPDAPLNGQGPASEPGRPSTPASDQGQPTEPRYRESLDAKIDHGVAMLANDDAVKVGTSVATMGHPLGLWWSYSRGDVAAIRFLDESKTIYVQTTAPTSRGNSGGGLYNDKGELVGIAHAAIFAGVNLAFYVHVSHVRALLASETSAK